MMESLLLKTGRSAMMFARLHSQIGRFTAIRCVATRQATAPQSDQTSRRPPWLSLILRDRRTFFEDVSHITKCFLTSVKQDDDRGLFSFSFDNAPANREIKTSFVALRESCRCDECFAAQPQQRNRQIFDMDLSEKPKHVEFDANEQLLHVTWASDGHKSLYSGPWLHATFTPHPLFEKPKLKLWTAKEYLQSAPNHDFNKICSSSEATVDFLKSLTTLGLVKIVNAPAAPGAVTELANHLNYMRRTHYGYKNSWFNELLRTLFEVKNKPQVSSLAYSYGKLTQHTDLPYFHYSPGIQVLHCIKPSKNGGESTYADGFAVAEYLRCNHPDMFDVLSSTEFGVFKMATDVSDCYLVQTLTPIMLNQDGSVKRVAYSDANLDSLRRMSPDKQKAFLHAYQHFLRLLEGPEHCLKFHLQSGEMAVFDNTRVTHGRESFDPSEARLLEGCYFDWDEIYSRLRILQTKLFRDSVMKRWPE